MRYVFFFLSLFLSIGTTIVAQEIQYDSSTIEVREFDQKALDEYRADEDYQYDRVMDVRYLNWYQRAKKWFWETLIAPLLSPFFGTQMGFVAIIVYVILSLLVIYLIYMLFFGRKGGVFGRGSQNTEIDFSELGKDIHAINFDELLREALEKKNYTRAVNVFYLKILKQLSDLEWIDWQLDKTNQDYILELGKKKPQLKAQFQNVTQLFEFICYGHFPVNQENYKEAEESFLTFQKELIV